MMLNVVRALIAAVIIVVVANISDRYPRLGAILLTLPIISILAFIFSWNQTADLPAISRLARETLILVPLGLPFFVPLAFAQRFGLSFWPALGSGVLLAAATIGAWQRFGPTSV